MHYVYLAGPIKDISYQAATDWRAWMSARFAPGIVGVSPLRGKTYLAGVDRLPAEIAGHVLSGARGIVARDLFDVRRASIVVANLLGAEKVSIGTVCEIDRAHAHNIPVVTVMEPSGNIHEHPFINEMTSFRVDSLAAAVAVVNVILDAATLGFDITSST